MPFAVTLRLDDATAAPVAALWQALAVAGIDTDRHQLGYPPHVTLAVYPDDAPPAMLAHAMQGLAARWQALPVALAGLGMFTAPAAIVWVAPVPSQPLLACQAELLAALPGLVPLPHYRPGAWVPHITLSGPLHDPAAALNVLLPLWRPASGFLDRVDLVRFRPVEIVSNIDLLKAE